MLRTNLYIGRGTFKDFGTYIGVGTKYIEGTTPCLENLSFWSDIVDVDNKLLTAQLGTDVPIENTNVVYFDGTSNGVATVTHEVIPTVTDVEVYFSTDNITWENNGAYNIVDDTLTIGYNGSSYIAGYYSLVTIISNTNPILQFTLAENNITESINRLDESSLSGFLFPNGVIVDNLIIKDNLIII